MAHKHIVYMMLVDAASQARDLETILKFTPMLEELAGRDNHQPYLAICHRAYGVASLLAKEYDQAEDWLEQALAIFDPLGMVWQTGRTLVELGNVAQARGDRSKAQELFGRARGLFEQMEAKPDVERMDFVLAE